MSRSPHAAPGGPHPDGATARTLAQVSAVLCAALMLGGCMVPERCYQNADCPGGSCLKGTCVSGPALDVGPGDAARPIRCPAEMVNVDNRFCLDRYEASRPDATAQSQGSQSGAAASEAGVLPWEPVDLATARAACKAAGKYLCGLAQWVSACRGPKGLTYAYGNTYDPSICNGIDTYCYCQSGTCAGKNPCPFPLCYSTCGADFRVQPTGSFTGCVSAHGAYDINGNVWELTDTTDGLLHFRGGAYNCSDSRALHRCDHDGTWGPSARGFRCCSDGTPLSADAGGE